MIVKGMQVNLQLKTVMVAIVLFSLFACDNAQLELLKESVEGAVDLAEEQNALPESKSITVFNILSPFTVGNINENNHTVTINTPYGTDLTDLTPTISHTGKMVTPPSGTARNFSSPLEYIVTARDGSTQIYNVTASNLAAGTYTVNFDSEGGSGASSIFVTFDSAYGPLPTPARDHFSFAGWYTGDDGTGSIVTAATVVSTAADHYLYAKWTPVDYELTFTDTHCNTSETGTVWVPIGMAYDISVASTDLGYSFDEWECTSGTAVFADDQSGDTTVTISSPVIIQATANTGYRVFVDVKPDSNDDYVLAQHGIPFSITTSGSGYVFGGSDYYNYEGWVTDSGTVSYADASATTTDATVTGGEQPLGTAAIRADYLLDVVMGP